MSASAIGGIGVFALFAMLILRVPVWIALTLVGFVGNAFVLGLAPTFALSGTVPFDVGSSYDLAVLPLFILMGEVASVTGLSGDLFKAARVILAGVRGGLAVGSLAASACFGAVCGSSLATAATMTRIALPEMRKAGYDPGLAAGALAAGGSLGILIPPSIILVIYAAIAEQSVPRLFAAGLLPGLVLTALYMIVVCIVATLRKDYAPPGETGAAARAARGDARSLAVPGAVHRHHRRHLRRHVQPDRSGLGRRRRRHRARRHRRGG